ncbi:MAG: hypothetical protein JW889_11185 [Verrucomicrobia bacterium]|nr:hypothetical protein [Verrucomicrobiota bacterium]
MIDKATASRFADWAEQVMLQMSDYLVAVKKLWYVHCEQTERPEVSLQDLALILRDDPRFYFMDLPEEESASEDEELRLEKMGFFRGPKVMLHSRVPSADELISKMSENLNRLMENLRKAYEIRPKEDERAEDELIDIMIKADQLRKEVLKAMSERAPEESQ